MSYLRTLIAALSLTGFLGALNAYPVLGQDIVTKDGEAVCTNWKQFLRDHPDESVVFTGYDEFGQKVKVMATKGGGTWRAVILAGAEDARFGCVFMDGDRFEAP